MAVITIQGLTKRFGDVLAVDNLSFEVDQGTVVGFLGPNGAGKTTTLRMLLGLVTPTAGTAGIDGRPYRALEVPVRHVGAVLEASSFILAVAPATTCGWSLPPPACPSTALTRSLSRSAWPMRRVGGSVASRWACVSAWAGHRLLGDPQVLILDEPANGLDPEGIHWLRGFSRQLADQGRTVLVSSHVLAEVAQTVDQVVIIAAGRLVTQSTLAALTARTEQLVRVRTPQAEVLRPLLAAQGIQADLDGGDQLIAVGTTTEAGRAPRRPASSSTR